MTTKEWIMSELEAGRDWQYTLPENDEAAERVCAAMDAAGSRDWNSFARADLVAHPEDWPDGDLYMEEEEEVTA